MPNTITAYNTFSAGTKARASQVNTNFSNHRGTLVPINENTATASDNTHDLGQSDRRWKDLYLGSNAHIDGAASIGGSLVVGSSLNVVSDITCTSSFYLSTNIVNNGVTISASGTLERTAISNVNYTETSVNLISDTNASGEVTHTGLSLTITGNGQPVVFGITGHPDATFGSVFHFNLGTLGNVRIYRNTQRVLDLKIYTDGASFYSNTPSQFFVIDQPGATTVTYHVTTIVPGTSGSNVRTFGEVKSYAYEMA